jgi:tRNA A-37 threonylcarbamoyl transferase component Bud32
MGTSAQPALDGLPVAVALRIDEVCNRFEVAWREESPPRIEDFVEGWSGSERLVLLREMVRVDDEYHRRRGESWGAEQYHGRFPEFDPRWLQDESADDEPPSLSVWQVRADSVPRPGDSWQEARSRGDAVAPEDVCNDTPDLLPDLTWRIDVLRRSDPLRAPSAGAPTDGLSGSVDTLSDPSETGARSPAASTMAPLVGGEFGGLRVVGLLGEGGMGHVYRAKDPVLRREVALKVMRPEVAARPQARERFLREARAMAALQHDNVVPVYQVGEVDGVPFLAMPLLQGESLDARLARQKVLPVDEVLRIGREAEGLAAAHARGLIHRDVKPANLWLEGEAGRVRLLDFGLAHEEEAAVSLTQAGTVVGTPAFMSPDQMSGQPLDPRTDLFSLGCVLYQCATGKRAFEGQVLSAVLLAVAEHHPPSAHSVNPAVPPGLSGLIDRLLAKAPADRPESARAVVEMLCAVEPGRVMTSFTGRSPPPLAAPTLERPVMPRRRPLWPWVTAAALAVGVVAAVGYFVPKRPENPPVAPPGAPTPAADPLGVTKLDVRVWKRTDPLKGLALGTNGALPLRAGDWMRIEAETNRPAYLYVLYLDARGEASPLFPWRRYDWDDRPAEEKRRRLNLPEDPRKDATPLTAGPSGIEAVLVLAREEPLTAAEVARLRRLIDREPEWVFLPTSAAGSIGFLRGPATPGPLLAASALTAERTDPFGFDPLRGAVWLGEEERFGDVRDRLRARPDVARPVVVLDPIERMRRLVRGDLKEPGGDVRGVCYPFEGK